jgi:hypothetical protein
MAAYFIDFTIVALLVIGITAMMGVTANGIGGKLFGGSNRMENVKQTTKTQAGWKLIGGKK